MNNDSHKIYRHTIHSAMSDLRKISFIKKYVNDNGDDVKGTFEYVLNDKNEIINDLSAVIKIKNEEIKKEQVSVSLKNQLIIRAKGICENCGVHLLGLPPHVHHINNNHFDNNYNNLEVLCPNCHGRKHLKHFN